MDKDRPKKSLHDKISLQIHMTMIVTTFSAVLLIFTCGPVFIHALTMPPETKLQTSVKYLLPQITRRYPGKMCYKSVGYISPFQQKKLNIGLTPRHPNVVRINSIYFCSHSSFPSATYLTSWHNKLIPHWGRPTATKRFIVQAVAVKTNSRCALKVHNLNSNLVNNNLSILKVFLSPLSEMPLLYLKLCHN